jgi:DNA-binding transcriptional MerR regulator
MRQDNERCYGIAELAELGGVTRRTVRYYVQRGLLPTPLGTGRGLHYTQEHLERLVHIRQLQEAGVPLAEIAARLSGTPQTPVHAPAALPAPGTSLRALNTHVLPEGGTWIRYGLADGVELHVRADVASLQPSQLAHLVAAARQTLGLQPAPHPSGRSNAHERNTTQLSGDIASHLDPTPERTH